MPGVLFPVAIIGGLALLALSSSSSSSSEGGKKRSPPPPPKPVEPDDNKKPVEPILDLSDDDKKKILTEAYKPIITGEDKAWAPTVDDIMAAQKCLQALGYDIGAVKPDGKIGPKTKASLLAFQKKYGLKEQTGTLTKETADLVCGAEKTKMGSSQGRSAGQQDKMAGRPRATDYAVRATQAGVDVSDPAVLDAFKSGYDVGYNEASPAGSKPVSDPAAAASAKTLGYNTGYAHAKAGQAADASGAFDASGLAGEYPAFKEGYNAGYMAGSLAAGKASTAASSASDVLGGVFGGGVPENRLPVSVASLYPQTVVYDAQGRPRLQRIG